MKTEHPFHALRTDVQGNNTAYGLTKLAMPCMAPTLRLCHDGLILAFACIDVV